jgi:uncharacterized phiE125 gp8 family phage protein
MVIKIYAEPSIEPVTLSELRTALNIDSGTMATDSTMYSSLPSGSYPTDYELLTCDVAPATPWAIGDIITGQTSSKTCIIVTVLTTKTFIVKSRSGAYTLGEVIGVTGTPAKLADQGAANPVFATTYNNGYLALGTPIDVLGHTTVVYLTPVNNGSGGTVDAKIQECDTIAGTYTDWSAGAFTQVTEANDTVIQEIAYTGSKKYIRVVAKPLVAASEFGSSIMVWEPNVSDDNELNELISNGRLAVENDTSKKIMQQSWDYCPKHWPVGDKIKVPFGNLTAIVSVSWIGSDSVVHTLIENTDYVVIKNGTQCGFVGLPYQCQWPSGTLYPHNPITVRFVTGWATQAEVPVTFKQALKKWCVNNYANKGDDVVGQTVSEDKTYSRQVNLCGRLNDMDFDL